MKIFCFIVLLMMVLFVLFPLSSLIMQANSIEAWKLVLTDYTTYQSIQTTILIALCCLLLNILIGTPAAEILARKNFTGKKTIMGLFLLPFIVPNFSMIMGIQHEFIYFNLVETVLGVVLIHTLYTLPYYIRSVIAGYQTFSEDYEHMASIFGANGFQRFFYVTLPHIMPSILVGSSLVITISFTQYLNTLIIGGGRIVTIPILMFPYLASGNIRIGSVFGTVFVFVNLILILVTEYSVKYIVKNKGKVHDKT